MVLWLQKKSLLCIRFLKDMFLILKKQENPFLVEHQAMQDFKDSVPYWQQVKTKNRVQQ